MKELLKNNVFLIVQSADLLQQIGIWTRNMALLYYIMDQTNNNPVAVSLLTALEYLPIFVFAIIGGAYAYRWNPKRTVILGDFLSAISMMVILVLISGGIWQSVFAAAVISAIVSQFSQPSSAVIYKKHIPDHLVGSAIGIGQSIAALFLIIGPILGTFIYTQLGVTTSITVLFVIFLLAAFIQLFLPKTERNIAKEQQQSVVVEIKEGVQYVLSQLNLKIIAAMFFISGLAFGITQPLDVFVIMERLGLEKEDVQWFAAAEGIGMLIGGGIAVALTVFVERYTKMVMTLCMLIFAVITLLEVVSVWSVFTFSIRILSGLAAAFFQVVFSTLMIKQVATEYIGRTNGVIMPLMMAGMLGGSLVSGFIVIQINLFGAYVIAAILIASCSILTIKMNNPTPAEVVSD